jgi:hypothetical protein
MYTPKRFTVITNHRVAYKLLTFTIYQIAFRQQLSAAATVVVWSPRNLFRAWTREKHAAE